MKKSINEKPKLYIIQGFIGAGKTTFSKDLATQKSATHLNPDNIVSETFTKEEYMKDWDKCFDHAVEKMWKTAKENLNQGKSVVLDMGFWKKEDRNKAREIAKECEAEAKHFYLKVPDEILKERIISTRPEHWAKIHIQNFEKNKQNFEEPTEDENVEVIQNY